MKLLTRMKVLLNRVVLKRPLFEVYDADDRIAKYIIETLLEYRAKENGSHPMKYLENEWNKRQKKILIGFYAYLLDSKNKDCLKKKQIMLLDSYVRELVYPIEQIAFKDYGDSVTYSTYKENQKIRMKIFDEGMNILKEDFNLLWM